ncbi:MAG: MFS transporter [Bacteroidaceae bacterium]|nr:MFS transporter [Bacteroidaceae bacterium]
MNIKIRLTLLNFLEFAVWGAYLTSMGGYLAGVGLGEFIGYFYSVQGFVSLIMPALMGIVADRWVQAQKVLSICHLLAGLMMIAASVYGMQVSDKVEFSVLFGLYTASVAFFMPTIALANSVSYNALDKAGLDAVKTFPPIRVFGTVGFIVSMWIVDLSGWQTTPMQFMWSGTLSVLLAAYSLTMPKCATSTNRESKNIVQALGLEAFSLFRNYRMALFFIFSMLLGCCLQITNGYAGPFLQSFGSDEAYRGTFGVEHSNILISLSQMSETLCILLIPFCLSRFGIKKVMLMSMLAWAMRFGFFAIGNPGDGVWLLVLSMIVYGIAFDFFNISGSLFVDKETDISIRNSAQGLFMMMTNGFGASLGMIVAGWVMNMYTENMDGLMVDKPGTGGWQEAWTVFAVYAFAVAVVFALMFRYRHTPEKTGQIR